MHTVLLVLNGGRHTHREETQRRSHSHKAHLLFPIKQEIQIMTEKEEKGRECMRPLR